MHVKRGNLALRAAMVSALALAPCALHCGSDDSSSTGPGGDDDASAGSDGTAQGDGGAGDDGGQGEAGGDGSSGSVTLTTLWNGGAHFVEEQAPIPTPNPPGAGLSYAGHREVFAVPRQDLGPQTVYFYQRCFENGKAHTCLAVSTDNGKTMSEDKGIVLRAEAGSPCTQGSGEVFLVGTTVAKVGTDWVAVYEGGGVSTCWATSPDGITWTKKGMLYPTETYHATPGIFVKDGVISVFTAKQIDSTRLSIDLHQGATMTKLVDKGIVFSGTGGWEAASVSMPRVVFADGFYWMTYEGASLNYGCGDTPDNQNQYGWGIARSTDLLTWERFDGNPILQSVDVQSCGNDMPQPFLDPIDGQYYVYHPVDLAYEVHREHLVAGSACSATQTKPNWREKNHACLRSCGGLGGTACLQRKSCSGDAGPDAAGLGTSWDCAICCN